MAELAREMPSHDNIVMNDDVDRVDVPVQPWIAIEPQDIQALDAGEMVAYEMLGPFGRAAGALMELNVYGMMEGAVQLTEPAKQDIQGIDAPVPHAPVQK